MRALKTARVMIPAGSKVCPDHYNVVSWVTVSNRAVIDDFTQLQIDDMLDLALSQDSAIPGLPNIDIQTNTDSTGSIVVCSHEK